MEQYEYQFRPFTKELAQRIATERRLEGIGMGEGGCRIDLSLSYPWRLKPHPLLSAHSPFSDVRAQIEWIYWPNKPGTGENDVYGRRSKTALLSGPEVVGDLLSLVPRVVEFVSLDPAGPVHVYSESAKDNMLYVFMDGSCFHNSEAKKDERIYYRHHFSCNLKTDKKCEAIWTTYEEKFQRRMKERFPEIPEYGAFLGCPPIDRENPAHACKGPRPAVPMTSPP